MLKKISCLKSKFDLSLCMIFLIVCAACGTEKTTQPTSEPQSSQPTISAPVIEYLPFLEQVNQGVVAVDSIQADAEDAGASSIGNIFEVRIRNTTDYEIEVTLPCGLVLQPEDTSMQSMMVIQPTLVSLAPKESASLYPYVVCIEAQSGIPEIGSTYHLGSYAGGDLLTLAECLCRETDIKTDPLGVQFAIWHVSEADALDGDMSAEAVHSLLEGQLDYLPEEIKESISSYFNSTVWLDHCGIK